MDEGTEQERNISTMIAVVYQLVINSLYEGIWKVLGMVFDLSNIFYKPYLGWYHLKELCFRYVMAQIS